MNSVEAQLPSATTLTPKNVTYYSVDMGFDVNPNGLTTTVYFQWQYRDGQGVIHTSTSSSVNIGSGTSDVFYYYTSVGPLLANTSYTYQCMAHNIHGTVSGGDANFTTLAAPAAPSATTSPASLVTNTSATLNGSVNPNSLSTTAYFEYGTNSSYGSSTPPVDLGAGASLQNTNCKITNLIGGTIYFYRVAANNTYGTNYGANTTFTTSNTIVPAAPSATTSPASLVTDTSATLNGSVNPNSLSTTAYFEYGTNSSYGSSTPLVNLGAGASLQNINCKITNLIGGTIYYYRVAANNIYGTNYGANTIFTTANTDPFSALELNLVNVRLLKTNGLIFDIQLPVSLNGYIVNGHIEVSTNLTSWTILKNFVGSNSIATVSDPVATNATRRFYRAAIPLSLIHI